MRFILLLATFGLLMPSYAQTKLSGHIKLARGSNTVVVNVPFDCWIHEINNKEIKVDEKGRFTLSVSIKQPQIIFLTYAGKRLHLYVEPGKHLSIEADSSLQSIRFGGSLGRENQFRQQLGFTFDALGKQTWNDSLSRPDQILLDLQRAQKIALEKLKARPLPFSPAFSRMTKADIHYFAASKLWTLIWNNGVWTQRNRSRFGPKDWQPVLKEAYQALNLSDESALTSYHYQLVITNYPRFLQHQASTKEEFISIAEAIFQKPFSEINQEIRQKGERYWEYVVFNHSLKGLALERAIASFLIKGIHQGDLEYEYEAYQDFIKRYPTSVYRPPVYKAMKPYLTSRSKTNAERLDIHFVTNPQQITSLDSLIRRYPGKVLYIDLWGSWCGPCRQEFTYTKALKDHFKGQPVDFVYLAIERSSTPEKQWQETIGLYELTGHHLLVGKELEKDLRKMYVKQGNLRFPSYILVDQTGKIITIQARRPSDKQALYEQIESLL